MGGSGVDDLQLAGENFECKVFSVEADEFPIGMSGEGHIERIDGDFFLHASFGSRAKFSASL